MRYVIYFFISAGFAFTAVPASANCWSNKAICQAICSQDCCATSNFAAPSDPKALSEISVRALEAELGGIDKTRGNQAFIDILQREIKTRGTMSTPLRKSN
jgi:hypothetical protein